MCSVVSAAPLTSESSAQPGPVLEVEPRPSLPVAIQSIARTVISDIQCTAKGQQGLACGGQLHHLLQLDTGRQLVLRVKRFKVCLAGGPPQGLLACHGADKTALSISSAGASRTPEAEVQLLFPERCKLAVSQAALYMFAPKAAAGTAGVFSGCQVSVICAAMECVLCQDITSWLDPACLLVTIQSEGLHVARLLQSDDGL